MRWLCVLLLTVPAIVLAQHDDHSQHTGMRVTATGIVMNENLDRLPRGCEDISGDLAITVRAGQQYAADRPGQVFGMDRHEVQVEPCSRVTVTFINDDAIRHQWMVHGLPKYLYPAGMFHIEAMGGQQQSGTFIAPAGDANYLVHCDMAQHMEKGMRGQLIVGRGSGDLWAVPGVSDAFRRSSYLPSWSAGLLLLIAFGLAAIPLVRRL